MNLNKKCESCKIIYSIDPVLINSFSIQIPLGCQNMKDGKNCLDQSLEYHKRASEYYYTLNDFECGCCEECCGHTCYKEEENQ